MMPARGVPAPQSLSVVFRNESRCASAWSRRSIRRAISAGTRFTCRRSREHSCAQATMSRWSAPRTPTSRPAVARARRPGRPGTATMTASSSIGSEAARAVVVALGTPTGSPRPDPGGARVRPRPRLRRRPLPQRLADRRAGRARHGARPRDVPDAARPLARLPHPRPLEERRTRLRPADVLHVLPALAPSAAALAIRRRVAASARARRPAARAEPLVRAQASGRRHRPSDRGAPALLALRRCRGRAARGLGSSTSAGSPRRRVCVRWSSCSRACPRSS